MHHNVALPIFLDKREGGAVRDTARACEVLLGTLIAVNRDAVRRVFAEQIADFLNARPGIAAADREKALKTARAELLAVEAREEMIVRLLEASGTDVARRDEASAALLLATDKSLERLAA